jgi:hypothetical protein
VLRDLLAPRGLPDPKDPLALKVLPDPLVFRDLRVPPELKDPLGLRDLRVPQVLRVLRDPWVRLDL